MTHAELIALLALVYLLDCLIIVPEGSFVFVQWLPLRPFTLQRPRCPLSSKRLGIGMANPLPPLGLTLPSRPLPFHFSSRGVYSSSISSSDDPALGSFVEFGEIEDMEVSEREISINGKPFARAASGKLALDSVERLRRILASGRPAESVRQMARRTLDVKTIRLRLDDLHHAARTLRLACNLLFLLLFALLPVLVWSQYVLYWLAAVGLWEIPVLILYWRARRRLYPEEGGWTAVYELLLVLPPPSAIRAHDHLSSTLVDGYHPLAVAIATSNDSDIRDLARQVLTRLVHPLPLADGSPGLQRIRQEAIAIQREMVEDSIVDYGLDPGELLRAPEAEPGCVSYCPRCRNQFVGEKGVCTGCPGIELQPLG